MILDLHTHSHYSSDGQLTIPELLDYYSKGDIVGITDHETIGGWDEFKTEAEKRGIRPVLGVEWFAEKGRHHILSYFINGIPDDFIKYMVKRRKIEKECMQHVYRALKNKYAALPSYEELMKMKPHPERILSVSVLAHAVSEIAGMTFKEVVSFIRNERNKLPENQQQETFYIGDIIEKIDAWGAVSVLAHPCYENGSDLSDVDTGKKIKIVAGFGSKGVEVISGKIKENSKSQILSLCDTLKLQPSVGSDFHYAGKGLEPNFLMDIDDCLIKRVEKWVMKIT